jgi:protein HIRA/HIR1
MRYRRPDWVVHQGTESDRLFRGICADRLKEDKARLPGSIFSLSVHPDGKRLATGGLDTKVRIWDTEPILDDAKAQDPSVPKLLSTVVAHTGTSQFRFHHWSICPDN